MTDMDNGNRLKALEEENVRLRRAIEELSILNDLSRAIAGSLNTEEIIQTVVRRSLRAVLGEQGVVTLVEESMQDSMKTLIRTAEVSMERVKYHFHQSLLGWMYINKKPLIINDPMTDERFRGIQWDQSIHSLLVVPLIVKSRIRGVLTVYNKKEGLKFTDDDLRLLSIIAAQSAQVVENARLNEQEKAFIRMKEELTVAAKIQAELLPTALPAIPGYDVYARTIPAASVGGDYYDVMTSGDPTVSFCVGDVSGKGMPAALLMANLQATLRAMLETHGDPGSVLQHANRLLFKSTSADKFATVFFARLNPTTNELSYANAGHDPAVLMSANGSIRELPATGLPVGLFDGMAYEESTLPMEPEDILVVFSDGITECMDRTEEQFGREKIVETLAAHRGETAAQVSSALLNAVNAFSAGTPQSDDQTLLVVRRNAT